MYETIKKINRYIRKLMAIVGALIIIFKLTDVGAAPKEQNKDGFQTKEFDDIW